MQKPTRLWKCFFRKHLWSIIQNNGRIYFHRTQFVTCLPLYTQKSWAMGELQGQNYNRNGSFSELYVGIHNGAEFFMKPLLKIQEPSMTLFFFLKALPRIFFFKPIVFCIKMSQWQFSAYQSCTKQEWKCSENWLIYRALQLCPQNQGSRKVWKSGEGASYNLISKNVCVFRALK